MLGMEKNDLIMLSFIGLLYPWLIFGSMIFPSEIVTAVYFIAFFGFIIFQYMWLIDRTYPYRWFVATLRPSGKVLNLGFTRPESKRVYQNIYQTTFPLAYPVKWPEIGKVKNFKVMHTYEFGKRFRFGHGMIYYQGMPTKSAAMDRIVLWEEPSSSVTLRMAEPTPSCWLAEASGDYFLPILKGFTLGILNSSVTDRELAINYSKAVQEAAFWKGADFDDHREMVKAIETNAEIKNELGGVLESRTGHRDAVRDEIMHKVEEYRDFDNAMKHIGKKPLPAFTKWMAATIIAVAILVYLYLNPQIVQEMQIWIQQPINMVLTVIVVGMALALAYFITKKRR